MADGKDANVDRIERRKFLLGAGVAGTAALAQAAVPGPAEAQTPATQPASAVAAPAPVDTYLTLTPTEIAFLSAAADSFIPADDLSPSGSDAGVVVFIDRQLAGSWGAGGRMYRGGPFHKGRPTQGYQLQLTPREFFGAGIAATNAWLKKTKGRELDRLAPADRADALKTMEAGKAELEGINGKQFFEALLTITMEGFFADPIYGGNRDKVGWKMVGYPGLPATYAKVFEQYRGKKYVAEPKSIADFS